ncbi:MAG: gliding motility-associated C-terminal domain-containing protein, partial [Bacteroidales bacterium]|nr:gliding motility-associated C-terminal domain-containing protein [Bacteroidales bacterium]
ICEGSSYTLSTANATNATLVTWSSNGTGSFDDVNLVNATYTPSAADVLNGSVILTMTVTSAAPCVGDVDQMVLTINPQATVNAGVDATICEGSTFTLTSAVATDATSLLWTSSGTGTFDDATILAATYTPSPADITAGSVTLTLTAQSAAPCVPAVDAMVLSISLQATADAGTDATICEGSSYTLSTANATNATLVTWSSNGTGSFDDVNLVNATYTPSAADVLNGSVILTMTVTSAAPCVGDVDQMVLSINPQATVNAGVDATICEGSTYTLSTAVATDATSLLWTSSGTGTFDDATILAATYTPSPADITAGSVTLTLTAQSAAPCVEATDAMVLTISLQATADAGTDATICEGSSYTLSTANATNATLVTWSSNGTGSFDDVNLVNATYTPSAADILNGSVILTMTVTSAAPCVGDVDQMVLTINKQAVVFAGWDAAICEGQTYTIVNSTATNATGLLWTTSGSGTFNDPTILYPEYTPSAADNIAGSVILTMTATSALPCNIATDFMILTISPQALAYAGSDATICEGSNYLISDAVATNASNILWTTTGTGSFNNPTIANPIYTPSPNDILDGFVTLTMIVNSDPPCGGDFDEMILTISRQANIYAGPDASICGNVTYTLEGATQQFATSLLWTTSGTGTFDDATILNPEYTPSLADLASGSVILTLAAQSAVPCGPDFDAMVLTISQQATAYAGADNTICEGSTYLIGDATATNAASVLWTTSGTGIFNNPTLVNPIYIPSPNDILDGYVILTMFVNSASPCVGTNDAMILNISRQAFVNAGPNATICEGSTFALDGAIQEFTTSILWTTSGTGTFSDPAILNPVYTPSTADISSGSVILTITGQSAAPCGPVSDAMTLTISDQATAYAGADATICEGSTYTLSDAVATNAISILWTTNGTGVFNNPTAVNPTYVPSQSDILNGSVTLTMYANSASPCPGASDAMVLTISRQAVVYAGPDAVICEGSTYQLSQATQTNATSLLWTTSGTGTFSNPAALNPVYTPSVPDIANGSVTLTLTAQSASPCSQTSDVMVLSISRQAIANAGPDATICGSANYTLTGASALNYVSVYWTTTGTGTFNSPYLVNPVYTPSQNDILDGSVILTMTAYSNAPCGDASDAMVLSFSDPVIIFAGADATICEGSSYTMADASQTNTTSLLWTTSGTGTFDDPTILNAVYTPSAADIADGSVILTITGQAAPPCSEVSDEMVLTISPQAVAFAGDDSTICSGSGYTISDAVATNAASILWTTTGTGVFNNPAIANPTYTPSQNDILDGMVTLSMQVMSASPCGSDLDEMTLFISRQAVVSAGTDHTICEGGSYILSEATQEFATSLLWTTSGTGTFSDVTILNPVYTPGAEDIVAGSVTLTLIASSATPCETVSDAMVLTISLQATANAGADATICTGSDYLIEGAMASNYTSVTWTTSGSGSFDNPNLLNPVYTPGIIDITNGEVTLTLRVESSEGCVAATDQMTLFIEGLPLADAGPDMSVCQGEPLQIIAASASNYSSLYWTYTGLGSMIGINTLTPTYVPAANETGNIIITLNVTGLEGCGGVVVSDVMILNIKPRVIADAGSDQTIPFNSTTVLSGNATNGSGSYVYTWQPSALLDNFNTTNPETVPLTGNTEFVLMVTDVVTGCQGLDTMMVFIDGMNNPPVAYDDYDTTKYNTSIRINIIGNDYDPENAGLTVSFCGYPPNGLVVLNSDNTITYTPYEGFSGDDSLCYTICDKGVPVLCDDAMVYIHVLPKPDIDDIVIFNGISPNADGNNDTWIIKGIEDFPDNTVKIFNRWGDKIADLSHYDNVNVFWDGTNTHGELVPDGTYYYILEIKELKTFTGWIYIRSEN